jgi:endoglucanase
MELLKILSETPAAPGREHRVRELIRENVAQHADRIEVDALGNMICFKAATNPGSSPPKKVMLSCHMDEIAFYVRSVDEDGFIRLQELGGFDVRNLFARQVLIQGRRDIYGVMNPGGRPIHIAKEEDKNKLPRIIDFCVDTGLSKEDLDEIVRPGDAVTLVQTFRTLNRYATGKCLDNRCACWVGIRILAELQSSDVDLYVAFTVQEEVGIRGARTCAFSIDPDIGIAVDVTLAVDVPGIPKEEGITKLGEGVAIKVMDSGSISDADLVNELIEHCEAGDIAYQLEILPRGATDAAGIQTARAGVRVVTLSIPCRYIHTVTETIHQDDLRGCVDLLLRYLSP